MRLDGLFVRPDDPCSPLRRRPLALAPGEICGSQRGTDCTARQGGIPSSIERLGTLRWAGYRFGFLGSSRLTSLDVYLPPPTEQRGNATVVDQIVPHEMGNRGALGADLGGTVVSDQAVFDQNPRCTADRDSATAVTSTDQPGQLGTEHAVVRVDSIELEALDHQVAHDDLAGFVERDTHGQCRMPQIVFPGGFARGGTKIEIAF